MKKATKKPTAKKAVKKVVKPKVEKQPEATGFQLEAKVNDQVFTAQTEDLNVALEELGARIGRMKTRLVLKVTNAGKVREQVIAPHKAMRIFKNDSFRRIFTHNINRFFK